MYINMIILAGSMKSRIITKKRIPRLLNRQQNVNLMLNHSFRMTRLMKIVENHAIIRCSFGIKIDVIKEFTFNRRGGTD